MLFALCLLNVVIEHSCGNIDQILIAELTYLKLNKSIQLLLDNPVSQYSKLGS